MREKLKELLEAMRKKQFQASQVTPMALCVSVETCERLLRRAIGMSETDDTEYAYAIGEVRNVNTMNRRNKYLVEISKESLKANNLSCRNRLFNFYARTSFNKSDLPKVGDIVKLRSQITIKNPTFNVERAIIIEVCDNI